MTKARIFLIDDHAVVRQGLRLLVDSQRDADVVVLDISMPDTTGLSVAAELRDVLPAIRIVALTRHAEKAYVQQMLQNGANGYVLKQTAGDVLLEAIRSVMRGGTYLDPAVAGKMFESAAVVRGAVSAEVTSREREVLTLVAWGHTNKEIATILGITVKTVESHKANAMQKLEIASRADLVRFALAQGWLERR
jgi:DNA-binding NarL/FixJ family response regulator